MESINENNNLEFLGFCSGIFCAVFNLSILKQVSGISREIDSLNSEKTLVYSLPEHLLTSNLDKPKKHMIKKEYSIYMNTFLKEIKKSIPNVNLSAFYENSKNFSIEHVRSIFKTLFGSAACFYSDATGQTKMIFISSKINAHIWHEFMHMASHRRYDNYLFSGFSQTVFLDEKPYKKNLGIYFNEGYTEVLTKRYFTDYGSTEESYIVEKNIAQILEYIVGKSEMELLYFSSELLTLCTILSKYDSIDNIINFFKSVDIIGKYRCKIGCEIICKKHYKSILKTLLKWYLRKLTLENKLDSLTNVSYLISPDILELFNKNVGIFPILKGLSLKEISDYVHYLALNDEFLINTDDREKNLNI